MKSKRVKKHDPRVFRNQVLNLDEDEYYWVLMEPAWHDHPAATVGQRFLAIITYFFRDVANGGLHQALYNFDPADVDRVLEGLDKLGASEQAAAVRSAIKLLLGESPPASLDERRALLETYSERWLDKNIEPLNEQLYDESRMWPYYRQYVKKHPSEFFLD